MLKLSLSHPKESKESTHIDDHRHQRLILDSSHHHHLYHLHHHHHHLLSLMDDLSICSAGSDDNSDDDSDHDEGDDDDEDDEEEDEQIKDSDYESSDQEGEEEGDSEEDRRCGDRAAGAGGEEPVQQRKSHNTGRAGGGQEAKDDHLVATSVASATAALASCSLEDGGGGEPVSPNHKNTNNNRSIDGSSSSKLQKVNKLSQYVPYSAQLESTRIQLWTNLKAHHCEASVAQGVQLERWIYACNQYLTAFGLAFTKADHIMLIRLCWTSLVATETDYRIMKMLAHLLGRLLKLPSLITRSELQLNWRELFTLVERVNHNRHVRKQTLYLDSGLLGTLTNLVSAASFYFSPESTGEMLAEWGDYLCIYSNKFTRYLYLLMLFLPMHLPPPEHHLGWKLWFEEMMALWTALPTQDTSHHYNYFLYLFSSLAKSAFGYIDWSPHLPAILQRVKKRLNCKTATDLELTMAASWFVYCISPQNDFLATLKAYFKFRFVNHKRVVCYLLGKFILRLKLERRHSRKRNPFWYDHTPAEHRLTPEIIADFSAWMCEQFEKITFADFEIEHLYNLSLLCSPELSAQVWRRLAVAEERPFEPDRLKHALSLFAVSLFPMVTDAAVGPCHRAQVIPVLCGLLRSVNTNDHTLAFLHLFAIRSIVIMGIPLEDCSKMGDIENLSEESRKLLKDSVQLEAFPDAFLDLCLAILDCNNDDLFRVSAKGIMVRNIIFEVLVHIFSVVGEPRREALTSRLVHYATSRIVESTEVVKIVDKMMLACLLSDPSGRTFELFFSRISANILSSIGEVEGEGEGNDSSSSPRYSDICKSEFVYNWRLLQTCFSFDGKVLLGHRREIVHLLKRIYRIDFEDNFKHNNLITDVLSFLFYILTSIYLPCYAFDTRVGTKSAETAENDDKKVGGGDRQTQILERLLKFPYTCKLRQLPLKWHQPSPEEISFAKELFREFIRPEMASLEAWTCGVASSLALASSQVEKSFGIILSFLGCVHCIPNFKKEEKKKDENSEHFEEEEEDDGELTRKYFTSPDLFAIDLFDGENFRETLLSLMVAVVGKLQRDHSATSDNVTIFKLIIEVVDYTLFNYKTITAGKSVSHSIYKSLVKEKSTLPIVQYYYIISYQLGLSCILKRWSNFEFCSTHRKAMALLLELSTCTSSKIRSQAQVILIDLWSTFPRSYRSCLPQLLANLGKVTEAYDAFKGTLYLLYGSAKQSIALSTEWKTVLAVWPALVAVNNAEKPKIARLFDVWFLPLFTDHFQTMTIERGLLSPRLMSAKAGVGEEGEKSLWKVAQESGWAVPTAEQVARIEAEIAFENSLNLELYNALVGKLLATLEGGEKGSLHWRFYILGCTLLDLLIRADQPLPPAAIRFFLDNLTNELISIRWLATVAVKKILFLAKPIKEVVTVLSEDDTLKLDKDEDDDQSLEEDCLASRERYESTRFHDKIHDGYLDGRPKLVTRFVDQPPEVLSRVQIVGDTFQDAAFLDDLFRLQSIEQEGPRSTCVQTVKLWKHLTQVFKLNQGGGDHALLFPRIEALLAKKKHNFDKFALEVLAGLVKASPCLPYDQLLQLKTFLLRVFQSLPATFNKESYNHWYSLFQALFLNRDLRRWGWVFGHFFASPALFTDRWGPYHQASFMYFIATALPTNWRYASLSQAVLDRLFDQLSHKYSYVRSSVSYMLSNAFHYRVGIRNGVGGNNTALAPLAVDFIERVQGKLKEALSSLAVNRDQQQQQAMATIKSDLFDTDSPAGQELVHLLDTVCHWLSDCLKSKSLVNCEDGNGSDGSGNEGIGGGALAHFASFLPQLALIQTSTALNETLQRHARNAISYIAVQVYRPEDVPALLAYLRQVAANWNWHTRAVASTFSHTLVFNNRFILGQRPQWVEAMVDIVLGLLQDEVIEVRESARQTLRDYIKWDFFNDHQQRDRLIEQCKAKAMRPPTSSSSSSSTSSSSEAESTESLILRHSGILGLVAFIYAYQTEMPDLLPDIVLFLARRVGDAQPIQKTVTTALRFFRKTHEPYWLEHKRKFSEQQLAELANVLVSSSCFA